MYLCNNIRFLVFPHFWKQSTIVLAFDDLMRDIPKPRDQPNAIAGDVGSVSSKHVACLAISSWLGFP